MSRSGRPSSSLRRSASTRATSSAGCEISIVNCIVAEGNGVGRHSEALKIGPLGLTAHKARIELSDKAALNRLPPPAPGPIAERAFGHHHGGHAAGKTPTQGRESCAAAPPWHKNDIGAKAVELREPARA